MIDECNSIIVGRFGAAYGIKGWIHLHSFTEPLDNILHYQPWYIQSQRQWQMLTLSASKPHGKGIIVKLADYDDRDIVKQLTNITISVSKDCLPATAKDEYYWVDLIDLKVVNTQGVDLGKIDHVFATGANDVIVIKGERERLLPFVQGDVIKNIDLTAGQMLVDWDADF